MDPAPRTYTGWKAGLVIVAICALVFTALNLLARDIREDRRREPAPAVSAS